MQVDLLDPSRFNQWNEFVDNSPQGDIFCYSWWLDAATKGNFKIYAIIENGSIKAGMPIAFDSENLVNVPPLTRTLGVLFKSNVFNSPQKQLSAERKWLTDLVRYLPHDRFVQMYMHHNFRDWLPFRWNGFRQTTMYTYLINYDKKSITDLWKCLDSSKKSKINKAVKNKIEVEVCDDFSLVYKFISLTYERQGLKFNIPFHDLNILDNVILEKGNRTIFRAFDANQTHAVLYAVNNHNSAYFLMSGSDPSLRNLGGHTLVRWEAIKYFSDKVNFLNLGGSNIERIEAHLRGFGGTLTPYFQIYNDRLLRERDSINFHVKEIFFHLKSILKRTFKKFRIYFK